jgi:HAE1 family hydrophobic/amphiphilic exporter-1
MIATDLAVRRPVTITMLVLVMVVLGIVSLRNMPVEFFPELNYPLLYVSATYEGVGPEEIEKLVTKPLEGAVSRVAGVQQVSSVSQYGAASIVVEFDWGTDLDQAMGDIREKIELYREDFLPEDMSTPTILRFDPSNMPIAVYGLTGEGRTQRELKEFAEDVLQPALERIDGVASAFIWGGEPREILVEVDQGKLAALGMTLQQVVQMVRAEDMDIGAGHLVEGVRDYQVKTVGEFQGVEDVASVVLDVHAGKAVRLSDVATVAFQPVERTWFTRMKGQEAVVMGVARQSDANTVAVARKVRRVIADAALPADVRLVEMFDTAKYIENSIRDLRNIAVFGAVLAVGVILVFMRSYRAAAIIGVAIPVSVLFSFFPLHFAGVTLNLISLGGLAIGVGMLVDNSIVVLENICRHLHLGEERNEAARKGAGEVGTAVTVSTMTTVVVFLPILFTEGLVRILFGQLAASITFAILASLGVALTLIPMMGAKLLTSVAQTRMDKASGFLDPVRRWYVGVLEKALDHRKRAILIALGVFVVGLTMIPIVGIDFMPQEDDGFFAIEIELPPGSPLESTSRLSSEVERYVASRPWVEMVFGMGGEAGRMAEEAVPNRAMMFVRLRDSDQRSVTTIEAMNVVRSHLNRDGRASFRVYQMGFETGSSYGDVEIRVLGRDMDVMERIALQIEAVVADVPGVKETTTSLEEARPELRFVVDREKASRVGIGTFQIGQQLRTSLDGVVATRIEVQGTEVDVRVRSRESQRDDLAKLASLTLPLPTGATVPLRELARVEYASAPGKIHRNGQVRAVYVGANLSGRDLRSTMADVRREVNRLQIPEGYVIEYGGEDEDMRESLKNLGISFAFAVLLVYMIMAALFESISQPLTIMFTVPFSVTGGLLGLLVAKPFLGTTLTVNAMIGFVLLAGIVVNNAIVLTDYIQRLRRQGTERREALLEAARVRLRPIMLTALTTILGLSPMALGLGEASSSTAPMAIAVMGGLAMSTLLTLVMIPVFYTVVDGASDRLKTAIVKRLHGDAA